MKENKFKTLKDWVQWANTSPLSTEADALMAKEVGDLFALCGTHQSLLAEKEAEFLRWREMLLTNRRADMAEKEKEIARLREALVFIANPRECPQCSLDDPVPEVPCYCDIWNPVYLAREALKEKK